MSGMATNVPEVVEQVYESAVCGLSSADQRILAEHILAKCNGSAGPDFSLRPDETLSNDEVFVRLERAFPGLVRPSQRLSDLDFSPITLPNGVDAVAILIEDRQDRDYLP